MAIKILKTVQFLMFLVVTSQLLFYFVVLSDALKQVSLLNFIELRKVVDMIMVARFKLIYYAALLLTLAVAVAHIKQPLSLQFIAYAIALVCIGVDVAIATKGNIPINTLINNFTPGDQSQDWEHLRTRWLQLINIRAVFVVVGMVSVFVGALWSTR